MEELKNWQAQVDDFSMWDYLDVRGDPELAVAFSTLFWPDFVEVDGHVLLSEHFDQASLDHWRQTTEGNRQAVEAVMNHVHVYDLFNNVPRERYRLELYAHLGRVLVRCWTHALQDAFPTKQFQVDYASEPEEYGPTVTFFQVS